MEVVLGHVRYSLFLYKSLFFFVRKGLLLILQCTAVVDPHQFVHTMRIEVSGDVYSLCSKV